LATSKQLIKNIVLIACESGKLIFTNTGILYLSKMCAISF